MELPWHMRTIAYMLLHVKKLLRKVISWAMCKLGVEEWLVSAVMSMYTCAEEVVSTVYDNSKCFECGWRC